jgi:hypothetical protein
LLATSAMMLSERRKESVKYGVRSGIWKEYIMRCSSAEWIARNGVPWDDAIVVSAGKLRKLWDSLSELRSCVCERRLERTVLRPVLLPVKTAQLTQFCRQVSRNTVKSLILTDSRLYRELKA